VSHLSTDILHSRDPRLLVSVRSASEAEAALAGGADLIDVKDPARGSLGRADEATLAAVVAQVAGRSPVSAALGEVLDTPELPTIIADLKYVKWGLARGRDQPDTLRLAETLRQRVQTNHPHCRVVFAAYADWEQARAPAVKEVCDFVCRQPGGVFLIDTFDKTPAVHGRPRTLLNWLDLDQLQRWREQTRAAQVQLALAGSLGVEEIKQLVPLEPDWIAVRGAACPNGRTSAVCPERVRWLKDLLTSEMASLRPGRKRSPATQPPTHETGK
jgi:hypothetical protein